VYVWVAWLSMQWPDYYLTRPAAQAGSDLGAFERLYAEQVEPGGGGPIAYRLDAPRWQFLCWLTDTKGLLLHGSSRSDIDEFEPRRPADASEFGGQRAVFAASDGLWAMFFALVDRTVATSLVNTSAMVVADGVQTSLYYFSINEDALHANPWQPGTVYVLPRRGFERQPDYEWQGLQVEVNHWASLDSVRPLASLAVTPGDFPFVSQVNGHHQPTVAARAAANPHAFPWRD
jgi:hypothetical protein